MDYSRSADFVGRSIFRVEAKCQLSVQKSFFQIQIKTSRFKCTLGLSALYVVVQKRSLTHIDFFWVKMIISNLEYYITQKHHSEIGQLVKTTNHNNLEDL